MTPEARRGLLLAGIAVIFFSTSPVLILLADPMPSLVKTWGRMLVAALAVGSLALLTIRPSPTQQSTLLAPRTTRQTWARFALYGLVAALHFYFYIASLDYTTPAHSLAIVYTAPVFVTVFSAIFLGEHVRRSRWAGIGVTVLGIAIVAGLEPRMSWSMALGDFLALLSAVTFGFYSVAGRYERDRYPLYTYASRVYGAAALWLFPVALLVLPGAPAGSWGWQQIAAVVALGIFPLALGHTLYNAALRRVHATYVNIIASQEVTGGVLLSFLILGQVPSVNALIGAAITLVGIAIVLR
ncbi:MAG TPA: DMT family transporter [Chloroflexia bacterium]|nr:DMT family transporter [Chloroflexia bacterium]